MRRLRCRSGRSRPCLEQLEPRLAPASVFVVPTTQDQDSIHFHYLSEALTAAGPGGLVTIEPGASPQIGVVMVTQDGVTIQGDPRMPASILPACRLQVLASNVRVTNLHL